MDKVMFSFHRGKRMPLKRKMAEHLEYAGKGVIEEAPATIKIVASEAVRAEAESLGVSLETVEGSGKDGRILKRDLQTYRTRMMTAQ
jgi:pyruvate/2-oxoglutarate dehydrogenase complex dihydrolipoamide acyltransferase (E2) component